MLYSLAVITCTPYSESIHKIILCYIHVQHGDASDFKELLSQYLLNSLISVARITTYY